MALHQSLLPLLLLTALLPAQDRVLVEARHAANWDDAAREGVCDIRLWVAEEAELEFRWDKYTMVATRGDEALDANTSCNRPLDTNGLGDFRMSKLYGRGQVTLVQGAAAGGDAPVILRVRDREPGTGAYHIRLTWNYNAGGAPGGGPSAFAARKQGNGQCDIGGQKMNFTRSEVQLRADGAATIHFYGDSTLQLMGRWRRIDDRRAELNIFSGRGMRGFRAQGEIIGRFEGDRLADYQTITVSGTTPDSKNLDVTFNAQ
ncbi:MAG: hypothetical protein IT162_21350 [Bryobacterales bacterium]|nr:hypothetical protein [Bryobacterales bacterium]